jgi:hypothetical protein
VRSRRTLNILPIHSKDWDYDFTEDYKVVEYTQYTHLDHCYGRDNIHSASNDFCLSMNESFFFRPFMCVDTLDGHSMDISLPHHNFKERYFYY